MPIPEKQLKLTTNPTNAEGSLLAQGEVVAAHTTADQVVRASAASDNALARTYGFVKPAAGIAASATGEIVTKRGTLLSARFEGSLTLNSGDRVYVSPTTAGSVTNVRPSTSGQVVIEVGRITSTLTYDGGGDLLAQIQFLDGERTVVGASSSSPLIVPDASNQSGGLIPEGALVAVDTGGAKRIQPFNASVAANPAARYFGVVTQSGGIANLATGEVTICGLVSVLFKASLTLADGDELYGSATAGSATNLADLVATPPPSGGVRQRLGVVVDSSAYDGTTNLLATCVVYVGGRREEP